MARIAGIDGCRAGWLRLHKEDIESDVTARVYPTAEAMFGNAEEFAVLAIDIPIGLPESGSRECDVIARKYIQPRGSSVFPAPMRATLAATTYVEACECSRASSGKSLSQQAFAILPK